MIIRFYFSFLFLWIFIGIYSQSLERDWRNNRSKIKIISYNIMNGFDSLSDNDRIIRFTDWIKNENPDILALNELCGFNEKKLYELANSYGHKYCALLKEEGYPVGITSKYKISIVSKNYNGFGHGLLHCKILDMDFLVTHLNPSNLEQRKKEALNIINYISEDKLDYCILMGDMNAKSPFDILWPEKKHEDFSVISTFISSSLYDLCYPYVDNDSRFTFPTRILPTSPKGKVLRNEQERIDFIFGTKNILDFCVDADIFNGVDNDYLSDHYPVGVYLLIDKK